MMAMIPCLLTTLVLTWTALPIRAQDCSCVSLYEGQFSCQDANLTALPDCVLDNTTNLGIYGTQIPIEAATFSRLVNLNFVSILNRDIDYLPVDVFQNNPQIRSLAIISTNLTYVSPETFQFTPLLSELALTQNLVSVIASDNFRFTPLLSRVTLVDNALSTLRVESFENTNLTGLYLHGNPWVCDCEMATFVAWMQNRNVSDSPWTECYNPPELRGLPLANLSTTLQCPTKEMLEDSYNY